MRLGPAAARLLSPRAALRRALATRAPASPIPMPAGAIAVEPVRGGPRASARRAAAAGELPTRASPPSGAPLPTKEALTSKCGTLPAEGDDLSDDEPSVDAATGERGGPTRAGTRPEPTRFGDYEIKGRCTDF